MPENEHSSEKIVFPIDVILGDDDNIIQIKKLVRVGPSWYFLIPKWWLDWWTSGPIDTDEFWVKWETEKDTGSIIIGPLTENELGKVKGIIHAGSD